MYNFSDVDRWEGFIYKKYGGEDKARWLITLSVPSSLDIERKFIFCTTTTVEKPVLIQQNKFLKLNHSKYNFFFVDCYIYFNEPIFDLYEYEIKKQIEHIQFMGRLDRDDMIQLYLGYWSHRMGSPIQLRNIKETCIRNEIAANRLPDPQKNK
ncbi:MAG: hypothetical protein KA146_00415 [Leptospiraceae bacterium]|nr:hypothetical protein [Leptospiraceae bacterium]